MKVYDKSSKVYESFEAHIDNCLKKYKETDSVDEKKYFSPYFAVIQSSGYGKSRLIKNLYDHNRQIKNSIDANQTSAIKPSYRLVVYLCARSRSSSGYPPPTLSLIYLLNQLEDMDANFAVLKIVNYLKECIFATYVSWKNNTKDEWYTINSNIPLNEAEWDEIKKLSIFVCIDEAKSLLDVSCKNGISAFRLFRRAFKCFEELEIMFGILDTFDRLCSCQPHSVYTFGGLTKCKPRSDPSRRKPTTFDEEESNIRVLDPFYKVNFRNLNPPPSNTITINDNTLKTDFDKDSNDLLLLLQSGRPLWATYKTPSELVDVAITKLLSGYSKLKGLDSDLVDCAVLAMLSCKLGNVLSSCVIKASELVAGFMATCRSICRDVIRISYPHEYALSLASSILIDANTSLFFDRLHTAFTRGVVDRCECAEIFAALILCLCTDHCAKKIGIDYRNLEAIPVYDIEMFLCELLPGFVSENIPDLFRGSLVTFSQFVKLDCPLSKEVLESSLQYRLAFMLHANCPGADLLVPLILRDNTLAYLLVQVKSYGVQTGKMSSNVWIKSLYPRFVFQQSELLNEVSPPVLGMYMQLGPVGETATKYWNLCEFKSKATAKQDASTPVVDDDDYNDADDADDESDFSDTKFKEWCQKSFFIQVNGVSGNFSFLSDDVKDTIQQLVESWNVELMNATHDDSVAFTLATTYPSKAILQAIENPEVIFF